VKRCADLCAIVAHINIIDLLPQLCSLNPGVDRLAFSAVWRMRANGELLAEPAPWFGRTVIRSVSKLDYGTAQRLEVAPLNKCSVYL
jgi:exoribonuclease R